MSNFEISIKFAIALTIGAIIGLERELSGRPAGLRTHILVCVSSCLVMLTGQMFSLTGSDPTRMPAQIISGIGFLGAGTIMKEGVTIKGLTTAATLWAVACIGIAIGAGFYRGAIVASIIIIIALTILESFEKFTVKNKSYSNMLSLICESKDVMNKISSILEEGNYIIREVECNNINNNYELKYKLLNRQGRKKRNDINNLLIKLMDLDTVKEVQII